MYIFIRIVGSLVLAAGLTLGAERYLHSQPPVQFSHVPVNAAPELDPTAVGGAMVILAAGLCILHERRRSRG